MSYVFELSQTRVDFSPLVNPIIFLQIVPEYLMLQVSIPQLFLQPELKSSQRHLGMRKYR